MARRSIFALSEPKFRTCAGAMPSEDATSEIGAKLCTQKALQAGRPCKAETFGVDDVLEGIQYRSLDRMLLDRHCQSVVSQRPTARVVISPERDFHFAVMPLHDHRPGSSSWWAALMRFSAFSP